eukprot:gene4568-20490_t
MREKVAGIACSKQGLMAAVGLAIAGTAYFLITRRPAPPQLPSIDDMPPAADCVPFALAACRRACSAPACEERCKRDCATLSRASPIWKEE